MSDVDIDADIFKPTSSKNYVKKCAIKLKQFHKAFRQFPQDLDHETKKKVLKFADDFNTQLSKLTSFLADESNPSERKHIQNKMQRTLECLGSLKKYKCVPSGLVNASLDHYQKIAYCTPKSPSSCTGSETVSVNNLVSAESISISPQSPSYKPYLGVGSDNTGSDKTATASSCDGGVREWSNLTTSGRSNQKHAANIGTTTAGDDRLFYHSDLGFLGEGGGSDNTGSDETATASSCDDGVRECSNLSTSHRSNQKHAANIGTTTAGDDGLFYSTENSDVGLLEEGGESNRSKSDENATAISCDSGAGECSNVTTSNRSNQKNYAGNIGTTTPGNNVLFQLDDLGLGQLEEGGSNMTNSNIHVNDVGCDNSCASSSFINSENLGQGNQGGEIESNDDISETNNSGGDTCRSSNRPIINRRRAHIRLFSEPLSKASHIDISQETWLKLARKLNLLQGSPSNETQSWQFLSDVFQSSEHLSDGMGIFFHKKSVNHQIKQVNANYITLELYCIHNFWKSSHEKTINSRCKVAYRCTIKEKPVAETVFPIKLFVKRFGEHTNHDDSFLPRRPCNGELRQEFRDKLIHQSPQQVGLNYNFDEAQRSGDYTRLPNPGVLRQIKHQHSASQVYNKDPGKDLEQLTLDPNYKNSIRENTSQPFKAIYFSDSQMEIIKEMDSRPETLHLDSTGNLCANAGGKPVHYYSAVIPGWDKNTPPTPIFSGLLTQHDSFSISHWIKCFQKHYCDKTGKYLIPQKVVTDNCLAMIYSILEVFGQDENTLDKYLKKCYKILDPTIECYESDVEKFMQLYICACHVKNCISKKVKQYFNDKNSKIRKSVKNCFDLLQNATDFNEYFTIFERLCILLKAQDKTDPIFIDTQTFFSSKEDAVHSYTEDDEDNDKVPETTESSMGKYNRHSSPFYKKALEISKNVDAKIKSSSENIPITNPYHNPKMLEYLLEHYLPLAPLWSGMLFAFQRHLTGFEGNVEEILTKFRDSNAYIESFWNSQKKLITDSRVQHPCKLLRRLIELDNSRVQQRKAFIGKIQCRPKRKAQKNLENDFITQTESESNDEVSFLNVSQLSAESTAAKKGRNKRARILNPVGTWKPKPKKRDGKQNRFINKTAGTFLSVNTNIISENQSKWDEPGPDFPNRNEIPDINLYVGLHILDHEAYKSLMYYPWEGLTNAMVEIILHIFNLEFHSTNILTFPLFFMETLLENCPPNSIPEKSYLADVVKKYLRDVEVFAAKIWIIPVFKDEHYLTIIVDTQSKIMYGFNPLRSGPNHCYFDHYFNRILNCFNYASQRGFVSFSIDEWKFCTPYIPIQQDNTSCGVFVCLFTYIIFTQTDFDFNNIRTVIDFRKILLELVNTFIQNCNSNPHLTNLNFNDFNSWGMGIDPNPNLITYEYQAENFIEHIKKSHNDDFFDRRDMCNFFKNLGYS